jgi:Mg-chelatase subunit ChlD
MLAVSKPKAEKMSSIKPFKNARLELVPSFQNEGVIYKVHLSVKPPATGERQGMVITLIFDTSGSMNDNACKVGDDATNYHTRMDLLKMVAELLVRMLCPDDILCLVVFSDNGNVLLPPTTMTDAGKSSAIAAIKAMRPSGCTNLWNALEVTHDVMARPEYSESLRYAIMLTDGVESYAANHAQGTVGAFASLPRSFVLNVFGFGAGINSATLSSLASASGGRFTNIADFTTLATSSINALATGIATCSANVPISVTYSDGSTSEHQTSLVQYGQNRDIVFATSKVPVSASMNGLPGIPFTEGVSILALARYDIIAAITVALTNAGRRTQYAAVYSKYTDTDAAADVSECAPGGELVMGCASTETWEKWGAHYSYAYKQALENDHRMNFKEKGQARLGGAEFEKYKTIGDRAFSGIAKPPPTGTSTAPASRNYSAYGGGTGGYTAPVVRAVATVASTNDPTQSAGCWAPSLPGGSHAAPRDHVWADQCVPAAQWGVWGLRDQRWGGGVSVL